MIMLDLYRFLYLPGSLLQRINKQLIFYLRA